MSSLLNVLLAILCLESFLISVVHSSPLKITRTFNATTAPPFTLTEADLKFPVPFTTLTLDIYLDEEKIIPQEALNTLLDVALGRASTPSPTRLVENIFRVTSLNGVQFAITGDDLINKLLYRDVTNVIKGLQIYYKSIGAAENCAMAGLVRDTIRGPIGHFRVDASSSRNEERSVDIILSR